MELKPVHRGLANCAKGDSEAAICGIYELGVFDPCRNYGIALTIGMWIWLLVATWLLGWGCIPDLLLLNKRTTATLAWLWALVLFPIVGPLLYLAIGSERVKRRRMKRRRDFRGKKEWVSVRGQASRWWKHHSK